YLRLEYQKNNFDSESMQEQNSFFSYLNYTLPNSDIFSLRTTWDKNEKTDNNFIVYLSYSINIGIPLKKKKNIGAIRGKVYDAERSLKLPIPNVLLSINEVSAVTNQNGEFIFPSLSPGLYYLWVERIFIGLNRVTTEKLPIAVNVNSGETTEIEIGVITSARIFGKVSVFAPNINAGASYSEKTSLLIEKDKLSNISYDSSNIKEVRSLSNVIIELTDGQEFIQHTNDEKGEFYFKDLRPGKWLLTISDKNLPEHHYLEQKEIQFVLKPGETKDITIRVFPRTRQIRIIDEGEIKQENK
ncbi:MAG: carboxypeptidase regulatory-like domain-containing protein, partial [Candidatus Firestonebacteria bacterium]|nr:carboxypeptidase regulatory-like domain-containing protein [Candidatus Firestonebacteria bacterium]